MGRAGKQANCMISFFTCACSGALTNKPSETLLSWGLNQTKVMTSKSPLLDHCWEGPEQSGHKHGAWPHHHPPWVLRLQEHPPPHWGGNAAFVLVISFGMLMLQPPKRQFDYSFLLIDPSPWDSNWSMLVTFPRTNVAETKPPTCCNGSTCFGLQ